MGCGISTMMNADRTAAPARILPSLDARIIHPARDRDDNDYPGSPSFRFYFSRNDAEIYKNNEGEIGVKSMSLRSSTSSITKGSKKEKINQGKKTSLRMVIPKHLLNMGSCCSSSDVGFHRLPEKTQA